MPMPKAKDRPYCLKEHPDCFALLRRSGKCSALDNTKFPNKDCPFYKPESEVDPKILAIKYLEDAKYE